jgi:hypothetical protein
MKNKVSIITEIITKNLDSLLIDMQTSIFQQKFHIFSHHAAEKNLEYFDI